MMQSWPPCKKILCIRPDNMGDLLMTTPALRALKQTFKARITMLTSGMAAGIAGHIEEIDETLIFDVPWVKTTTAGQEQAVLDLVAQLRQQQFDAAVIFTVYSQNPMPTLMLAYLAGIPLRLAYCRENPYQLLTHWVPDQEPYDFIRHQVRRDLDLVAAVGAHTAHEALSLNVPAQGRSQLTEKLSRQGVDLQKPWLVIHPGVSEPKREYPAELWAAVAGKLITQLNYQVLITGSAAENGLAGRIQAGACAPGCYNLAGLLGLNELILLLKLAPVLIAVNTGPVHIAAALQTPVVVLYALTNPQHTPWQTASRVLPFSVPPEVQSKNEVIRHVNRYFGAGAPPPCAEEVLAAVQELLATSAGNFPSGQLAGINLPLTHNVNGG